MVRNPPTKLARFAALGVLAVFLVGALAPIVAAEPDRERPKRERPQRADDARAAGAHFEVRLDGTATGRNNETYRFELVGEGRARARESPDGNTSGIVGLGRVQVRLVDLDGNVVKEGRLKVKLAAHETDDGTWKWHLAGFGKRPRDLPNLVLRGTATPDLGAGALALVGHGKVVVKLPDDEARSVLRIDAAGTLSRA